MKYFKKIIGEHVYLSPMNIEDAKVYTKWLNNPEISKYLRINNSLITIQGEEEYLNNFIQKEFHLAIIKNENDELIGNISLDDIDYKNGTAELGIFIGEEDNLGKGYGSEAIILLTNYGFKELRLHSIFLTTYSYNQRAIKAYKKCGFEEFGRRHEAIFHDGNYADIVYMEMINKEC